MQSTMERPTVSITVDTAADAAYIALSDQPVSMTCELTPEVLVDLDELGVAVGVECLRLDADLPLVELMDRFHVRSEVIDLLQTIRPSVRGFMSISQGHDGQGASKSQDVREVGPQLV